MDDDPWMRALIVDVLTSGGYSATVARDGSEALELLRTRGSEFACLTVDLAMPKMSGVTLLQELRRDPTHRTMPAVVVSSYSMLLMQSSVHLANAVVQKPFRVSEFLDTLAAVTAQSTNP